MNFLRVRRILGFSWFYLLIFFTAALLISADPQVNNFENALAPSNLPAIFLFSLPMILTVLPSLVLFRQRRWGLGIVAAIASGIVFWGALQMLQTTAAQLTLGEALSLLPQVMLVFGVWTIVVSLPAALLLKPATQQR
ncbi:MAG: hypothetical protein F6J95_000620 [Leptolyngbya sp. SIO1E4]|nr:hypothetical protein [Leptolyngbya sp. SIO1E4]